MMANSFLSSDPELAFVAAACLRSPGNLDASTVTDWERVAGLAVTHRVYPRVWRNAGHLIPAPHAASLREKVAANANAALRVVARTVETVALLRKAGVDAIVLKGPLLARELYGDFALRVAGDVDLLVREQQLLAAAQTMAAAGYAHHTPITPAALARHRKSQHDIAFAHPQDHTLIELHADIAQPHYGYRIDLDGWWQSRCDCPVGGAVLSIPSREHAYLLSALHAAKHRWHRLDLVADIAAYGELGIERAIVVREARAAWLLKIVETGEALATGIFGAGRIESAVARRAISQLVAGKDFGRWDGIWFDLRLRARPADQLSYLWKRLLSAKLVW